VSQVPEKFYCFKRNTNISALCQFDHSLSDMAFSRFRAAKTAEEEVNLVRNAVPKSTQYKNKWAYGIFEEWQRQRLVKVPIVEVTGLFKATIFI